MGVEVNTVHVLVCATGRGQAATGSPQAEGLLSSPSWGREEIGKTSCPWGFVFLHVEIIAGTDAKFKQWEGTE